MAEISPLRRRMIEDMTVRNLSPATQQSYLSAFIALKLTHGLVEDFRALGIFRPTRVRRISIEHGRNDLYGGAHGRSP